MLNVSRLNEPSKTIKMGATVDPARREHPDIFALRSALGRIVMFVALGCAQDEVAPAAKPAVATPVPIVDMSPSAERPRLPAETPVVGPEPVASTPPRPVPSRGASVIGTGDIAILRAKGLIVPVTGVRAAQLVGSFGDARGTRGHEAMDIGAPRGTPVLAADEGTVLKLFTSRGGGLTIYVADATKRFIYYYAHLDAYAPALAEGQAVAKGQQIGTVGTTGNAPPNTPHLHFAILRNDDMTRWWTGTPIDPFPFLRSTAAP